MRIKQRLRNRACLLDMLLYRDEKNLTKEKDNDNIQLGGTPKESKL